MHNLVSKHGTVLRLGLLYTALLLISVSASSLGCVDCAEYDEYCVDLDCCEDACVYVESAGYRCR